MTLIFSALQGLPAAKAGTACSRVFVGRLDDVGHDGMEVVGQLRQSRLHPLTDRGLDQFLNDWSKLGHRALPEAAR